MNLKKQIEELEGRRKAVYKDHLGYWTIGVGRLVDERKGGGLTDAEIDYLLDNDIKAKTAEVEKALPWFANLNAPRQAVLVGMAFQMGTAGLLGFVRTLAEIRDERWANAGQMMMQSLWARQTPSRARRMARQMETGDWQ